MKEMLHLQKYDSEERIKLVDLHDPDLINLYPHINKDFAMKKLHGQLDSGKMLYGLDVSCKAWALVDKYRWLMILRWPIVKPVADLGYKFFARYRETIAYLLTGKKNCNTCAIKKN